MAIKDVAVLEPIWGCKGCPYEKECKTIGRSSDGGLNSMCPSYDEMSSYEMKGQLEEFLRVTPKYAVPIDNGLVEVKNDSNSK